jgi:uncharacterized membrane protein
MLVSAATVLVMAGLLLPPSLRWLTVPLVLWLPGHALVCADFGHSLELTGVRRVCLSVLLSLATYPILALVVSALGVAMSGITVAVSTWVFIGGCAAVVWRRTRRSGHTGGEVPREGSGEVPGAGPGRRSALTAVMVPGAAIVASMLIAWAGVTMLPRKPADEFSAAAFDGPWALVSSVVPVQPDTFETVAVRVWNHTSHPVTYRVTGAVDEGEAWSSTRLEIRAGHSEVVQVVGAAPAGACRARLSIGIQASQGPPLNPLTLYLKDAEATCESTAPGS